MSKALDARIAGNGFVPLRQACEVKEGWHVVQRFFHGRITELEPLLHEMDAQERLYRNVLLAASPAFECVGHYQRDQFFCLGNHQFHRIQDSLA